MHRSVVAPPRFRAPLTSPTTSQALRCPKIVQCSRKKRFLRVVFSRIREQPRREVAVLSKQRETLRRSWGAGPSWIEGDEETAPTESVQRAGAGELEVEGVDVDSDGCTLVS